MVQEPDRLLSDLIKRFRAIDHDRAFLLARLEKMKQIADRALEPQPSPDVVRPLAEVEKEHIIKVLEAFDGHRANSADVLGIAISTLNLKIAKYGIEIPGEKSRVDSEGEVEDQLEAES